jgi:GxxExxY protein
VDNRVILELKAVDRLLPIHEAQLMTYLRLTECRAGLLINCNTVCLTDRIRGRVIQPTRLPHRAR